ncbi:MAG: zinc ribbon domain-containing protein, partial [Actinomycetota bacterium]|nr:zinc ribbon domain-containing protein [Actinomycetota bacterium]
MDAAPPACPQCTTLLPPAAPHCPRCGLRLVGPDAAELWTVDQALIANQRQRAGLMARRETLLTLLRQGSPAAPVSMAATAPVHPQRPSGPALRERREASPRSVQNVLLSVGGLLLAVAAVVFTVVAWGRFGLTGRAAILLTFTVVALTLPGWLVRRRLSATAETIALLGLVLMGMDGYAGHAGGLFGWDRVNGFGYAAAVCAGIAAVAAGYPLVVPVRLIRPVGVAVGQLPIPLLAVALHATATGAALAGTCVAAGDVLLLVLTRGPARWPVERWLAGCLAGVAGVVAVPLAGVLTFFSADPG